MEKPILSPNFTIEDIHKLREYNYEMTKHMTDKERMDYYNEGGRAFQREIDEARHDYDELWNQYAIGFNNKLESDNGGDWNKLDEVEQEIAALWKLAADMYSAGFDEFFLNWGYECYSYAMRGIKRVADANAGLKKIDCNNVYKLFDTAYTKVFARFENDERIKTYEDIMEYLTEDDEKILEKTYDSFDEKAGPLLCTRAYEFYCVNLKKTV